MICKNCGSEMILNEDEYETIFRCMNCNKLGCEEDFK